MKLKFRKTFLLIALLGAFSAGAQEVSVLDSRPDFQTKEIQPSSSIATFNDLLAGGEKEKIRLTGIAPHHGLSFSVRRDEIPVSGELDIAFTPSPALIPIRSQLNVFLNGNLQRSYPIQKDDLGKEVKIKVELDPLNILENNQITLELVGHETDLCENLASTAIWAAVNSDSKFLLTTQKLRVANELSNLPHPFVDVSTNKQTILPFVFPARRDPSFYTAAAVVASWAGAHSDWRGIKFPVFIDETPAVESHFVIFATNTDRPDFLKNLPRFTKPTVMMADAPDGSFAKMLVIGAPDDADLIQAAQGLASGEKILTGDRAIFNRVDDLEKRIPYDAPKWADTSKPIYFRDLQEFDGQLSSTGIQPGPINLTLRLPPDLFFPEDARLPLQLKYRYTKPNPQDFAQLRFLLNGTLVQSYPMDPQKNMNSVAEMLPWIDRIAAFFGATHLPGKGIDPSNRLTFDFKYTVGIDGGSKESCRSSFLIPNQVEIDPNSKIDLTEFHHFIQLPDINKFMNSGFPYSRMADLSETAFILPAQPTAGQLETLFNTAARISAHTGLPGSKLLVTFAGEENLYSDRDLIMIGNLSEELPKGDEAGIPALIENAKRTLVQSIVPEGKKDLHGKSARQVTLVESESKGGIGAIVGMRSPFEKDRSALMILSSGKNGTALLNDRIADIGDLNELQGSVGLVREGGISSYHSGETYFVGHLPWHTRVWMEMKNAPMLFVFGVLFGIIILSIGVYQFIKRLSRSRVKVRKGTSK